MQRTLAAATALSAPPLAFEIYLEHYKGSFGDKWMWTPIVLTPPLTAAAIAGVFSERAAKTVLPALSALYCLDGLIGVITHVQGVRKKPGGFCRADLQPRDGAAAARARLAAHDRRLRPARAADGPGALSVPLDFREAQHLPKVRGDEGADPSGLPRQRRGTTPQMHGRYPDYDCLENAGALGRRRRAGSSLGRVEKVPELRFFTDATRRPRSSRSATSCSRRTPSRAFPCSRSSTRSSPRDGSTATATPDMPDDRDTWRLVARGLDEAARARGAGSYAVAPLELSARADRRASPTGALAGGAWDELDVEARLERSSCAACWPPSTRTPGPGTRSASAARPTRAATRGSASALSEAWEGPEAFDVDPVARRRASAALE